MQVIFLFGAKIDDLNFWRAGTSWISPTIPAGMRRVATHIGPILAWIIFLKNGLVEVELKSQLAWLIFTSC